MTKEEARALFRALYGRFPDEDDGDTARMEEEARALFRALYGRFPDEGDGDTARIISLCYAALPTSAATPSTYPSSSACASAAPCRRPFR
jgi:hypothetical protein